VSDAARALLAEAQRLHAARDTKRALDLAQQALALDPEYVDALEYVATALITRRSRYRDGLALIERALRLRGGDPGLWYAAGWCYEFAAHEIARRAATSTDLVPKELYERAADAFRRCLSLDPEGKLRGDAEDLLDHVENELAGL
jgi:tetratricopeptide (TPR) repeat protein